MRHAKILSDNRFLWVLLPDYGYFGGGILFLPYLCWSMSTFPVRSFSFWYVCCHQALLGRFFTTPILEQTQSNYERRASLAVCGSCPRHVSRGIGCCGVAVAKDWLGVFGCWIFAFACCQKNLCFGGEGFFEYYKHKQIVSKIRRFALSLPGLLLEGQTNQLHMQTRIGEFFLFSLQPVQKRN